MKAAPFLFIFLVSMTVLVSCQSKTREIHIRNNIGVPVDVIYIQDAPAFESEWKDYEGKRVGDDDPSTGCELCNLQSGETDLIVHTLADKSRLKIVARTSADRTIVYLEAMTGRELKERDWTVLVQ